MILYSLFEINVLIINTYVENDMFYMIVDAMSTKD